jgi:hypothetical protein
VMASQCAVVMSGDRLEVNVTFDERGYIGSNCGRLWWR